MESQKIINSSKKTSDNKDLLKKESIRKKNYNYNNNKEIRTENQ